MNCTTEDTCKISKPMAQVFLSSGSHCTWTQLQPYRGEGCSTEIRQDRLWGSTSETCCCHIHAQGSLWFFFWSQRQTFYLLLQDQVTVHLKTPLQCSSSLVFNFVRLFSASYWPERIQEQVLEFKTYAAALKPRCMLLLRTVLLSRSEGLAW